MVVSACVFAGAATTTSADTNPAGFDEPAATTAMTTTAPPIETPAPVTPSVDPPSTTRSTAPAATPDVHATTGKAQAADEQREVSASFDKPRYRSDEPIGIHVTITNPRTEPVTEIMAGGPNDPDIYLDRRWLQPFHLAAGESSSFDLVGHVNKPDLTTAVFDAGYATGRIRVSRSSGSRFP